MVAQRTSSKGRMVPSRRGAQRILQEEAYRRITSGDIPATLSDFAAELSAWLKDAYPSALAISELFIEDAIRDTWHRRHDIIGTEL